MKKNAWVTVAGMGVLAAAMMSAQSGSIGFGTKESEVKSHLAEAVLGGNLPVYPSGKLYHAAAEGAQVAFVKAFLATAKEYSETAEFKADYAKRREEAKPAAPEAKGSPEQQMSDEQKEQRKKLEETRAEVNKMPAEMQKQMKDMLKQMEDQLDKQASDPDQQAAMKQVYESQAQATQDDYKMRLEHWETDYPTEPSVAIVKRLKAFLALTADLDFDAKLEAVGGGRTRFANPDYESKSSDWKLCFRAGKEPVSAAKSIVTDWLHQLGAE